jgi:hypothetical protein
MKRVSCGIALGIVLLVGSLVSAQNATGGGQQAPPPMTNLQVWPTDTSRAVVPQFMNAFNDSLGVQCNYCHVEQGGRFDFASDDKREKKVARQMILLRDSINVVLPAIVGKPPGIGPTSGNGRPGAPLRVLLPLMPITVSRLPWRSPMWEIPTPRRNGGAAGLAKFKELRRNYGGQCA